MHRRSRPSARLSTTSPRTSKRERPGGGAALARLIDALPPERLEQVFTHTSWALDRGRRTSGSSSSETACSSSRSPERSTTGFPTASEGRLAKIRAHVVSRQSCASVARELGLGERLLERARDVAEPELQRIARSRNVLAALLEAAMAAVYLEHGFEKAEPAVVDAFDGRIEYARTSHVDNKTELQEALARTGKQVVYLVLDVEGPPTIGASSARRSIDGEQLGDGGGSTKKAAEQEAAQQVLAALGVRAGHNWNPSRAPQTRLRSRRQIPPISTQWRTDPSAAQR